MQIKNTCMQSMYALKHNLMDFSDLLFNTVSVDSFLTFFKEVDLFSKISWDAFKTLILIKFEHF